MATQAKNKVSIDGLNGVCIGTVDPNPHLLPKTWDAIANRPVRTTFCLICQEESGISINGQTQYRLRRYNVAVNGQHVISQGSKVSVKIIGAYATAKPNKTGKVYPHVVLIADSVTRMT